AVRKPAPKSRRRLLPARRPLQSPRCPTLLRNHPMLWADYHQTLDPLHDPLHESVRWSPLWSTILAALPVVVLFCLLVPRRWLAPRVGAPGAITALLLAVIVYQMPVGMALMSFVHGAAFGLLPVGWTIFFAMLLYNITVETGQFSIVRRSVAGLSSDARI